MRPIKRAGCSIAAVVMAAAAWQAPHLLRAGDNPFGSTATSQPAATQGAWTLKNPDAKYAIDADIGPQLSLSALATEVMSANAGQRKSAIDQLRAAGPAGLNALLTAHQAEIARHRDGVIAAAKGADDSSWPRITAALDGVAAQRNAYASGLYRYTDLSTAKAAAKAAGRPILSLRLLGNLNEEYSCANSRFFRTVLYANNDVSKYLRDHFILHWQSVRPVPVITIDFGDGRIVRRTITGNSIHYVLTAEGKVVDGIPGLYGPSAFLRDLNEAEKVANALPVQPLADQSQTLERWHGEQLTRISGSFDQDYGALNLANKSQPVLATDLSDGDWSRLAAIHSRDAVLDSGSRALMETKASTTVDAVTAGRVAMSKSISELPIARKIRAFQRSVAEDTVRNEYLLHVQIHRWLMDRSQSALVEDVAMLNKRVYAELFLTPDSDPWLGLVPADAYTALDDDGICH